MTATVVGDDDDDSAVWAFFKHRREEGKLKRASNRECSTAVLAHRGINFSSHNGGAHLIVQHLSHVVDFWPGTGRWIVRESDKKGFGVFNLIKYIQS